MLRVRAGEEEDQSRTKGREGEKGGQVGFVHPQQPPLYLLCPLIHKLSLGAVRHCLSVKLSYHHHHVDPSAHNNNLLPSSLISLLPATSTFDQWPTTDSLHTVTIISQFYYLFIYLFPCYSLFLLTAVAPAVAPWQ